MAPLSGRIALVCGVAVAVFSAIAAAQQQVYRYVDKDGRVIYTDRAPPVDGKEVQAKRLSPNYIENNEVPIATVQAAQRFPVTLYTFACGAVCQSAEALLNRRGVPYTTVIVTEGANAAKLQSISGEQRVPVLQIGDKVEKGFLDSRWQAALDEAGYPKTPPARRASTPRAPEAKAAAQAAAPKETSVAAPAKGTDYPK